MLLLKELNASGLGVWNLHELRMLDLQESADIQTILQYSREVSAALQSKEA